MRYVTPVWNLLNSRLNVQRHLPKLLKALAALPRVRDALVISLYGLPSTLELFVLRHRTERPKDLELVVPRHELGAAS